MFQNKKANKRYHCKKLSQMSTCKQCKVQIFQYQWKIQQNSRNLPVRIPENSLNITNQKF